GFELERAPLLRIALIRLGEQEWQFVWSHHHILLDAWSRSRVFEEVTRSYDALRCGEDLALPAPRPFRDYIGWLAQRDIGAAEAHWRRALAGLDDAVPLGIDRPASPLPAGEEPFGQREIRLPRALSEECEAVARRRQLTPNTLMLGAWGLLLSRYADAPKVVVGTVVSGRPADLPGVEAIVGPFLNSLPVLVHVEPGARASLWLAALQAEQAEMRAFEWTPLIKIQRWVRDGKTLLRNLFVFQNAALAATQSPSSFRIAAIDVAERTDYPLTLTAEPGSEITLRVDFDRRYFDPPTALRLLAHWASLIGGLADPADRPLGELALLSPAERQQLITEWNATEAAFPAEALVHELFTEQAKRTPAAPAAICAGRTLSYAELDARAEALADRLRALGVGPESRVGLATRRGLALAASLLGILKAGAAYVPLDPGYPRERLAYMSADAGLAAVVSEPGLAESLPEHGAPFVLLAPDGTLSGAAQGAGETWSAVRMAADGAAYVIYTSGSTGLPKAVVMAHRPLVNFALAMARQLRLGPADRMLQFASPSFDVLLEELLPTWLSGGAVVFPGRDLLLAVEDLSEILADERITGLELPAAYWQEWVHHLTETGITPPATLRFLILGAEKPAPERVEEWMRHGVELVYVFGLTETAVTSSLHSLAAADAGPGAFHLPIGHPVANHQMYVLDSRGEPLPVGVTGELYLGGVGVARGYAGRPELTAERFVPDFVGEESGARLYRTGDLVRRRGDGALEFLGRGDAQVKVRGFRVELGEVEEALRRHPEVRDAVVELRGGRLVGYVVPSRLPASPAPSREDLRRFLQAALPEHMVPGAFVYLDSLPLTPNGKIDRGALPAPEAPSATSRTLPRTEVERHLAEIWAAVLGLSEVGVDDDFFALGGDSILSIQVTSRARRAGLALTPRQVFEQPTIARLAQVIGEKTPAAEARPVAGPVPLTPIQRWFFDREPSDPHWFNLPLLLRPARRLSPRILETVLVRLAAHHDALRLRFWREGDEWVQSCAPPGELEPSFATVDLSALPADRRPAAIYGQAERLQGAFDLGRGPLFMAALFDFGAEGDPGRLLLLAHHLVVDTISMRILVEDLAEAYDSLAQGMTPVFAPRTTSIARWNELLAALALSPELATELAYWAAPERTEVAPLPRPAGPRGEDVEGTVETLTIELDAEMTRSLVRDVTALYRLRFEEVLLAALGQAVAAWSGERLLLIDREGHGRDADLGAADPGRTVGWFATLYPVLLDLRAALAPRDLLRTVKEQSRAVPRRGLGWGLLRYLGPAESRARLRGLPPAEILFNYVGQLDAGAEGELPFALAGERVGPAVSPRALRSHRLEVNAGVVDGRLRIALLFPGHPGNVADADGMTSLAAGIRAALADFLAHSRSAEAGGYTPADFPLARLGQVELDRLLGRERGIADVYPLSPLQKGMLFHVLLEPEAGQYLGQLVCELVGALDRAALRTAWQALVERHPALRTSFRGRDLAEPLQVVHQRVELPYVEVDWRGLSAAEKERRAADYLAADRRRGIDPERPPLLHWLLARSDEDVHLLVWTFLQTNLDGWSLPLLFDEGLVRYEALVSGGVPRFEPTAPFRDYIEWLSRQDMAAAELYWRRALAEVEHATPLPGALPVGAGGAGLDDYREDQLRLSRAESAALLAFLHRHQLTLSTLVEGVWAAILARFSGAASVVFGAAVSGRPAELPGVETIVGLFLNMLPVRVTSQGSSPVLAWLRRIQAEQAEARQFEHTPLADIQRWSGVPAGQPLFESILVVENYPVGEAARKRAGSLAVRGLRTVEKSSYPLSLVINPGVEIAVTFSYYRSRFTAGALGRLRRDFGALLRALLTHPEVRVEDLSTLAPEERQQLLVEWSDTAAAADYPADQQPVHRRVEAWARRSPGAPAVVAGDRVLTYGDLVDQADRWAGELLRRGLGTEEVVGVCLPRSPELVAAQLAVLKAGGAYLPLDPDYPEERIAYILGDSRTRWLLSRADLLPRLAGFAGEVLIM
ncbi:MAG: hypothetical protein QOJ16_894, partial [Acidobacteriota bacterium]|nr:hypothetical protein [Acidobacteriota bacterium]